MLNIKIDDLAKSIEEVEIAEIEETNSNDIAIIGISAKFPLSEDINEFWDNIKNGRECITKLPRKREAEANNYLLYKNKKVNKMKYKKGGYLDRLDEFDCRYFNISPKEASLMDPNQRLFLQTAFNAIEDAGYGSEKLKGSRTGIYFGFVSDMAYQRLIADVEPESLAMSIPGNLASIIPGRVSYLLDLKGPSVLIDTACSSSLVAVHTACNAIRNGDCEMAIAGSSKLNMLPLEDGNMLGIESKSYKCRAFDDESDGTCLGEGIAAIILKPLSKAVKDMDNIYAVIKGSAVNQDGSSAGMTAPNAMAQADVIERAWKNAKIDPNTVTYIETHGTGTKLGDPIEIDGIQRAFSKYTDRKQFCAIGSTKTNIGHLDSASGIAGLVKAVLALKNKKIPPSINFNKPNRNIKFEAAAIYVNTRLADWESEEAPRRCGISGFGLSGTNCHIILEEAPEIKSRMKSAGDLQVLALSAKSLAVLNRLVIKYKAFVEKGIDGTLSDLCYTANTGRGHYNFRLAIIFSDLPELIQKLNKLINRGLKADIENLIYFFEFKVSLNGKDDGNEISEGYQAQISALAKNKIEEYTKGLEKTSCLQEICSLYIKGASIEWNDLYKTRICKKISLPVYPFERKRCWLEIPEAASIIENSDSSELYDKALTSIIGKVTVELKAFIENTQDKIFLSVKNLKEFEEYGLILVLKTFQDMSIFIDKTETYKKEELLKKLGIIDKYYRFFNALLDILERGGFIHTDVLTVSAAAKIGFDETISAVKNIKLLRERVLLNNMELESYVNLLDVCVTNLDKILTGTVPASNIIFPNASTELVEKIYKDDKNGIYCNMLAAECIMIQVEERLKEQNNNIVRILEVGAGTGGTTRWVLEKLAACGNKVQYFYTDLSPTLVEKARDTFGKTYSFVEFKKFDLEKDSLKQGFEVNNFDIVLGANVIHATKNITNTVNNFKKLMKTNGILVMIEGTEVQDFSTLTFGVLDGWWLYDDPEIRLKHSPVLSTDSWRKVLKDIGFRNDFAYDNKANYQTLIMAENEQSVISENYVAENEQLRNGKQVSSGKNVVLKGREGDSYSQLELQVANIWGEVLGFEEIYITDNFFELGGDSIIAMKLVNILNDRLVRNINVAALMEYYMFKDFVEFIDDEDTKNGSKSNELPPIIPLEAKQYYSLSSAQKRVFIIEQLGNTGASYNIPLAIQIKGKIDKDKFESIFKNLILRHEALRTSFDIVDGEPVQIINKEVEFKIDYIETTEEKLKEVLNNQIKPFDLKKAPLFRVSLVKFEADRYILFYDLHHIISDGISQLILLNEFKMLNRNEKLPKLEVQYKDYSAWHNSLMETAMLKKQEQYWEKKFSGVIPVLNMPLDFKRPENQAFAGNTIDFVISSESINKVKALAQEKGTTLNSVLMSAYALLLSKYSNQRDIVVGSLVAGRMHKSLENVIGMFVNFVPVRFEVNYENDFEQYFRAASDAILETYENQDYPFERIIEKITSKLDRKRNPLFDTVFIFHNESEMEGDNVAFDGLLFSRYKLENSTSKLDFKIDAQMSKSGELHCNLEYNTALFKETTIMNFINKYKLLLDKVIELQKQKLSSFEVFNEQEKKLLDEKRKLNSEKLDELTVAVSATFTSEPIEDYIVWWSKKFNMEVKLNFAQYNQVFQELINPESLLSSNKGINLLLIRFEDWMRNDNSDDSDKCKLLEDNFQKLLKAFSERHGKSPHIVGIFPVSTHLSINEVLVNYIKNMNRRWIDYLRQEENTYIIDFSDIDKLYGIEEIFDLKKDIEGHMPFGEEYYAATGTYIARKICALKRQQFKVIVLDCDNTLWQGICGEEGEMGVCVDENFRTLQKFMLEKNTSGMLLALCSKNNEQDVWKVFDKNTGMLLKKDNLITWRINWQSKSENIKSIAKELNLGLDSFIFIDDNPMECAEVMEACPMVLTLQLPKDTKQIPAFLEHVWAFDILKVTEEDRNRTQMYATEKKRKEIQEKDLTIEEFIKSLKLKVSMKLINKNQIARVAQLTQRTNQFNLSTIRRTEEKLETLLEDKSIKCWVVEVMDKFGEYGLVGVILTKERQDSIFIDTFLLSCRVLGRGVENAILSSLAKYCGEIKAEFIEADFYPTAKNKPFAEFLLKSGWEIDKEEGEYTKYKLYTKNIPQQQEGIDSYYKMDYVKESAKEEDKSEAYILDHIAIAVSDIDEAKEGYKDEGYLCGETVHDPIQNAYLAMCYKEGVDAVELVAPVNEASPVHRIIKDNGEIPYHICYRVENCDRFLAGLAAKGIEFEVISDAKQAVLFNNRKVTFIRVKDLGLIELLENETMKADSANLGKLKQSILQIVIKNVEVPIEFLTQLGYIQEKSSVDIVRKARIITLFKLGAGKLELVIPTEDSTEEYKFFSKNGAHPYKLIFENKEAVSANFELSSWEVNYVNEDKLLYLNYLSALRAHSGSELLKLPVYEIYNTKVLRAVYEAPANEKEEKLVKLWQEVLGLEKIGINDNFFELGGHSLKATSLVSRICREFNVEINLSDIFKAPTIKQIERCISQTAASAYRNIEKVEEREYYPLAAAQKRVFLISQMNPNDTSYNIPLALSIEGRLDISKFENTFNKIIERHEILRTSFGFENGEPVQKIHEKVLFKINYLEAEDTTCTKLISSLIKPFSLKEAPLLRVYLIKVSEDKHILFYDMHHIVGDGFSYAILMNEFRDLYTLRELSELKLQYKDYAVWHNMLLDSDIMKKQEKYWMDMYSDNLPVLNMPLDFERPEVQEFKGRKLQFFVNKEVVCGLKDRAQKYGTTLNSILMSVYALLLNKYSGQNEIVVGSLVAGRRHESLEGLIGMFVNYLPLKFNFKNEQKITEYIKASCTLILDAYENQDYPFDRIIEGLNMKPDRSRNPIFDTVFIFHNEFEAVNNLEIEDLKFSSCDLDINISTLDFKVDAFLVNGEELNCELEYNTSLFKETTMLAFIEHFNCLLEKTALGTELLLEDIEIFTAEEKMINGEKFDSDNKPSYKKVEVRNNSKLEYKAPADQVEEMLSGIFKDILRVDRVGVYDNFFEIGGTSLKAVTLVAKIYKEFRIDISITDIFENPSISKLREYIGRAASKAYFEILPAKTKEYYALSSAQKRMFMLNQLDSSSVVYNEPAVILIEGKVDQKLLQEQFKKLIKRHEALRTAFEIINDQPVQKIEANVPFELTELQTDEYKLQETLENYIRPFDLAKAPIFRAALIRFAENRYVLICDMYHIISDELSMNILVKEFMALLMGKELRELKIQYKDYAEWQNELITSGEIKKQEVYWLNKFEGELPVLNLPTDFGRPEILSFDGDNFNFSTNEEMLSDLQKLAKETKTTLFMVLLSAYNILLSKYSGQEEIIIGSPISGRQHEALDNIIGMFVNTLALRNRPDKNKTFEQFLNELKYNCLSDFENQDFQFEELVDKLSIKRDLSRNPLFDVVFSYHTGENLSCQIGELNFTPYNFKSKTSKFDITLHVAEAENNINFSFEYSTKLFTQITIDRMSKDYIKILETVLLNREVKIKDIDLLDNGFKRDKSVLEDISFEF